MKKNKKYLIFLAIGLILIFIVGPTLRFFFAQVTIDDGSKQISEESITSFTERYSKGFTLSYDETCHIEFSNYYPNISVYLIILTENEFRYYNSLNGSNPTTGEQFVLFQRQTGSGPSIYYLTSYTIAWSGSTYGNFVSIEFRGDNRISIPGNYFVVVRGQNAFAGSEEVKFNIKVAIDGPGKFLQDLSSIIGILIIALTGLIWIKSFIKSKLGER